MNLDKVTLLTLIRTMAITEQTRAALLALCSDLPEEPANEDRNEVSWGIAEDEEKGFGVAIVLYRF